MGRILEFDYMYQHDISTHVRVDYKNNVIEVKNYTDDLVKQVFGKQEINMDTVEEFFKDRVFPEQRVNCKELLKALGLQVFDAEEICKRTHGVLIEDVMWVRFAGENLTWDDVKLSNRK